VSLEFLIDAALAESPRYFADAIICADAMHLPLPDKSVDLCIGSPPYCGQRTYGIGADRTPEAWVPWMIDVTLECLRVCRGPVWWVWANFREDGSYRPASHRVVCALEDLGVKIMEPCVWIKNGMAGQGGAENFRRDHEYVEGFANPGDLPYARCADAGVPPKYAPGGAFRNRRKDGSRENRDKWGGTPDTTSGEGRRKDGSFKARIKKRFPSNKRAPGKVVNGEVEVQYYTPPVLANPGSVIRANVGGGLIGDSEAHEHDAPFPEALPKRWITAYCPPGGTVLDPFGGSGTTAKVARDLERRFVTCDLKFEYCELTRRRLSQNVMSFA
jgi:site-specific DNA-methyltransferase (adenine-specific)